MPDPAASTRAPVDPTTLRAFARLVAAHHEIAATGEPLARDIVWARARRQLTEWATGAVGPHRAERDHAAGRLEVLLRDGAQTAGRDLRARVARDVASCRAPRPLTTPRLLVGVEVDLSRRARRIHLDYDPASGPACAATAVRVLEAAGNDDAMTVGVLCGAERHLTGHAGLMGAVDVLAELAAALLGKDGRS